MPEDMKKSPTNKTTIQPRQAAILMLITILDTTWRAFVPTIGGTLLGVGMDNLTHQAPLFTVIFITTGFVLSALLIALQLRKVRSSR